MSGYIKTFSDNGNLREEYFINNEKIEGILKIYDINNRPNIVLIIQEYL